ncbi:MAG: HAMP domain-containing histidine kinase [Lachnospiraceae bacterium]|nr:HAMP domain-containing histidine kinase [Lachnospiraceae bacterium]
MIKRMRRQFIAIAMGSMGLVLAILITVLNVANYIQIGKQADQRLDLLADNHGVFPDHMMIRMEDRRGMWEDGANPATGNLEDGKAPSTGNPEDGMAPGSGKEFSDKKSLFHQWFTEDLGAETPFDTRYFTVTVDGEGNVIASNLDYIASVTQEEAEAYVAKVRKEGSSRGYESTYRYVVSNQSDGIMYLFVDCTKDLQSFRNFLLASISICVLSLLVVFILIYIFSKWVVKPMAESYEKQKRFITDASHEIKTPLTIIDANCEVLEMMEGENEWTQSIRKQMKRLASLTEKLVMLSRMDEEGAKLEMNDFNLTEALSDTIQTFESVAEAKGRILEVELEENVSYHGNEGMIRQMCSLLVDNALKYTPEGGKISITLKSNGRNRLLYFINDAEDLTIGNYDVLFERFYRRDASRSSQTGGHGIGLSVVASIVAAHKGKIRARSEDGKKMEFKVVL